MVRCGGKPEINTTPASKSMPLKETTLTNQTKAFKTDLAIRLSHSTTSVSFTEPVPVNSHNEWDTLEEVIVGRVENACFPPLTAEVKPVIIPKHWKFFSDNAGQYFPDDYVKKAQKEVGTLCEVLRQEGVIVRRPDIVDHKKVYTTPDFTSPGMYSAMPRDILLVLGDEIIEAPMAWRTRFFEYRAYRSLMKEYFMKGAKWTTAPKPLMSDELYDQAFCTGDEEELCKMNDEGRFATTEFEPCFDAADFMRAGKDLFVQRSGVTNYMGIEWMRRHLGDKYKIHVLKFDEYFPMHINCSLSFIGEGLALINPSYTFYQRELFEKAGWKLIDAPAPMISDAYPLYFSTRWIANANVLMIDEKRALVDPDEIPTHKTSESTNISQRSNNCNKNMPVPIPTSCDQGLDDIEDIFQHEDLTPDERMTNRSHVTAHVHHMNALNGDDEKPLADSIIPGTQTIFIKTWGCAHNNSDSEYMAGQLAAYGYKVTTTDSLHADLWLLNSCTVKNPAEDGFKNEIKKAQQLGKYVVVAGCVPQGQPRGEFIKGLSVVGVQQIDRVVEVVEETLKGHTVRLLGQKKQGGRKIGGANLNLPKVRKNPLIEIIAINTGCLNQCTYCKTKHARGELGSYPPEEIVARAKQSFQEGVVEIWLTSEDTGAYGKDIGVTLPELLYQLVEVIPVGCMMRVGMTNPPYIQEYLDDMAKILNHSRVYSFLHIPVQSASNEVLNDMKREYTIEDFKHTVDFLKDRVPRLTVATDLICGFPTETPEDFEKSCDLVRQYEFPSLFINQFFPRPGTPAAKMKRVPTDEVKERTKQVSAIFQSYLPYERQLGSRQMILITEEAKDKIHFVGHNKSYDQVLIKGDQDLMGKMVEVEIYETGKHFVKGRLVNNSEIISPGLNTPLPKGVVSGASDVMEEVIIDVSQPLPRSIWNTILHIGLFVLILAIVLDICRLFLMVSKNNYTWPT